MDCDCLLSECPELDKDSFKNDQTSLDVLKCDSLNNSFSTKSKQHYEDSKSTFLIRPGSGSSTSVGLKYDVQLSLGSLKDGGIKHERISFTESELIQDHLELQGSSLDQRPLLAEDNKCIQIPNNERQESSGNENHYQNANNLWLSREERTPSLNLNSFNSDQKTDGLQKCVPLSLGSLNDQYAIQERVSSSKSVEQVVFSSIDKPSLNCTPLPHSIWFDDGLESSYTEADEFKGSRIPDLVLKIFASILVGRRINLMTLANTLNILGIVSQNCVQQLESSEEDSNEKRACMLTENIEKRVPTLQLVDLLYKNNFERVAQDLYFFYIPFAQKSRSKDVSRKIVGERRKIQFYFKRIKQDIHRLFTSDPHAKVGEIGNKMLKKIEEEKNPGRKRFLCDEYICLKAAEIDAHTNQTDDVDPKGKPFQEIEAVIAESSCPEISLILMLGRQADISSSLGTNPNDGESFLVDAFMWQDMCERCIEATDMIYKSVVFNLLQFQRTKDKKYQRKLFEQAAIGLDSLSEESDDVRLFWSRLFRLRIIFCHLGIGKRGEIIEGYHVSPESLKVVERMFQEDKLEDLEHRRKMMYGIAVARFCHLKGAIGKAKEIIDIVMDFAREGIYSEKENIAAYQGLLKNIDEDNAEVVILSDEYLFRTISPIYSRQSSRSSTTDTNTSSEPMIHQPVLFESSSSGGFENSSDSNGPPCEKFSCSEDEQV